MKYLFIVLFIVSSFKVYMMTKTNDNHIQNKPSTEEKFVNKYDKNFINQRLKLISKEDLNNSFKGIN